MKVNLDGLADAILDALTEEEQRIAEVTKAEVRTVTAEAVTELRSSAPRRTGDYARSWRQRTEFESKSDIRTRIYNDKHYQLTHLLEFGHAIRNGTGRVYGRVDAYPHVAQAEEHAAEKLMGRVKVRISG